MRTPTKNIGASVRERLLQIAKRRGEDFQLVLTRYLNERLLYRLTNSVHGPRFILKGATLFTLWNGEPHRATRDIDLLGLENLSGEQLRLIFVDVMCSASEDDGVTFDLETLVVAPIREEQQYGGLRVEVTAHLAKAKVPLQIDIGFGDAVTPDAVTMSFPTLLSFPAPNIRAYPRETVVAEKLEAMVKLGHANSRMKDFYDLLILARTTTFEGALLARAITATFQRRQTIVPLAPPVALTADFVDDKMKRAQWAGFLRKSGLSSPGELRDIADIIRSFATEPMDAARLRVDFQKQWAPGGPWL